MKIDCGKDVIQKDPSRQKNRLVALAASFLLFVVSVLHHVVLSLVSQRWE